jgi:hypothetical protein
LLKISGERHRLEAKNKKDETRVMEMLADLMEARARHDQLQKEHNKVLMQQVSKNMPYNMTDDCHIVNVRIFGLLDSFLLIHLGLCYQA